MSPSGLIALTGYSGYVGEGIVKFFEEKSQPLRLLGRRDTAHKFSLGEPIAEELLQSVSVLIHCAWDMKVPDKKKMYEINVKGSEKLFKAVDRAGVKKIIFISSIAAYEGCKSYYGKTKLEVERMTLERNGTVIRPSLVFDENLSGGMIKKLKEVACKIKFLPNINARIYPCYRPALCETVAQTIQEDWGGKIITASHPQPYEFKELLSLLAKTGNKTPVFIPCPWQVPWLGLKVLELLKLPAPFKSDSLISLLNPCPAPDFSCLDKIKAQFKRIEEVINLERKNS